MVLTLHTLVRNRYLTGRQRDGSKGLAFEAFDLQDRVPVALRVVPLAGDDAGPAEKLPSRVFFEQAAACLLSLRHPNLPAVLDAFVDRGTGFLVGEPISGDDLATRLQRGEQFSGEQVAEWADQLLDALDYLHTLEPPLVHGQIDLSKLVPLPDGRIELLGGQLIDQEQAADPRDDLTALGTTLYTLVTGSAPPSTEQRRRTVAAGRADPFQPARRRNAAVPAALSYAIQQALSLKVVERPDSAAEMRALLNQAPPEMAGRPEPSARRWWPLAAIGGGLILVLVVVLMLLGRGPGATATAPPTSTRIVVLASPTAPLSPTQGPTAVALASATAPLPPTSAPVTAVQVSTPTQPVVPSATPVVVKPTAAPVQLTVAAIQPAALYTGIVPTQIALSGANLDQVRSARLLSEGRVPIDLTIVTQAPGQLILAVAGFPEPVSGEIPYQIELNGQPLQQSIIVRDFISVMTVRGIRVGYTYTGRVIRDAAGAVTRMRERANQNSARTGQLRNGDRVQILRDAPDGWYQVRVAQSGDPQRQGQVGWIERWLVDNQNVPPQKFVGRLYSKPTDEAVICGGMFESSIFGSVENAVGEGIGGAAIRVTSSDGRNRYTVRTAANGTYTVTGLGCTTWIVSLVSVPNQQSSFTANQITVRNLNGGRLTAAEVRFRINLRS